MSRRICVLGTGTEIGKTYTAEALARALALHDPLCIVTALKPVESGIDSDPAPRSDGARLARASHPAFAPLRQPYAFTDPISPHLAARRENATIDPVRARQWIDEVVESRVPHRAAASRPQSEPAHWVIVETAGAVFSPISDRQTNFDLAVRMEPAIWILVAPDRLGVLHDVTATLAAMRQLGRTPDLLLLSESGPADASRGTNAGELIRLGIAKDLHVVPNCGELPPAALQALRRHEA